MWLQSSEWPGPSLEGQPDTTGMYPYWELAGPLPGIRMYLLSCAFIC